MSDIVGWFSTEDGVHIPIHSGQSKAQAMKQFADEHADTGLSKDLYEMHELGKAGREAQREAYYDPSGKFTDFTSAWGKLTEKYKEIAPKLISTFGDDRFALNEVTAKITGRAGNKYASISVEPGGMQGDYVYVIEGSEGFYKSAYSPKDAFNHVKKYLGSTSKKDVFFDEIQKQTNVDLRKYQETGYGLDKKRDYVTVRIQDMDEREKNRVMDYVTKKGIRTESGGGFGQNFWV